MAFSTGVSEEQAPKGAEARRHAADVQRRYCFICLSNVLVIGPKGGRGRAVGKQKETPKDPEKGWRRGWFRLAGLSYTLFYCISMREYFIRRFLLIPPTLLGVTLLVFTITRFVPGGPMERALQEAQKATEGGGSTSGQIGGGMSEEQVEELEEEYGFDKPILQAYLQWLGVLPRERRLSKSEFRPLGKDKVGEALVDDPDKETLVLLKGSGRQAKIIRDESEVISATYSDNNKSIVEDGWEIRIETMADRKERWSRRAGEDISKAPQNYDDRAIAYKPRFAGLALVHIQQVLSLIW